MSGHSVPTWRIKACSAALPANWSALRPIGTLQSCHSASPLPPVQPPRLAFASSPSPPLIHFSCPSDALSHPSALASHLRSASPFSLSLFFCGLTICFDACVRACLLTSGTKAHEEVLRRLKETSARTSAANDWTRGRVTLSIPCMASFPPFLPPTHRSPVP